MNENIPVIYEKGILRPLQPLRLPEQTQLEIRIIAPAERDMTATERAYQALLQAGLVRPLEQTEHNPFSDTARQQAADAYGQAGPLSAWIIAERDAENAEIFSRDSLCSPRSLW